MNKIIWMFKLLYKIARGIILVTSDLLVAILTVSAFVSSVTHDFKSFGWVLLFLAWDVLYVTWRLGKIKLPDPDTPQARAAIASALVYLLTPRRYRRRRRIRW